MLNVYGSCLSILLVPTRCSPYVCVHILALQKVRKMPLDEVVVLDADANSLEIYHNDLNIIPSDVVSDQPGRFSLVCLHTGGIFSHSESPPTAYSYFAVHTVSLVFVDFNCAGLPIWCACGIDLYASCKAELLPLRKYFVIFVVCYNTLACVQFWYVLMHLLSFFSPFLLQVSPLKDTLKKHTSALDETVAKAFLDAFVFMIGGYRDALRFREVCFVLFLFDFIDNQQMSCQSVVSLLWLCLLCLRRLIWDMSLHYSVHLCFYFIFILCLLIFYCSMLSSKLSE